MNISQSPLRFLRRYFSYTAALGLATVITGLGMGSPASAQTCQSLEDVGSGETEVTKTVSTFGVLFVRSNWHTDFAVPGGTNFRYFVATILPIDGDNYDIDVNLKYSDDTIDQAYTVRSSALTEGQPLRVRASSRSGDDPFQINVRVGGSQAEGSAYTVSVVGCR